MFWLKNNKSTNSIRWAPMPADLKVLHAIMRRLDRDITEDAICIFWANVKLLACYFHTLGLRWTFCAISLHPCRHTTSYLNPKNVTFYIRKCLQALQIPHFFIKNTTSQPQSQFKRISVSSSIMVQYWVWMKAASHYYFFFISEVHPVKYHSHK